MRRLLYTCLCAMGTSLATAQEAVQKIHIGVAVSGSLSYTGINSYLLADATVGRHTLYAGPKLVLSDSYLAGTSVAGYDVGYTWRVLTTRHWASFINADFQSSFYKPYNTRYYTNVKNNIVSELSGGLGLAWLPGKKTKAVHSPHSRLRYVHRALPRSFRRLHQYQYRPGAAGAAYHSLQFSKVMSRWILLICLLAVAGCKKTSFNVSNLQEGRILVIGHAGSGEASLNNNLPPNSWESLTRAVEYYNADGVETDLQLSTDSTLFMFHDDILESSTSCYGCVNGWQSALLSQCAFKPSGTSTGFSASYLSRFEDLVAHFAARNVRPHIFVDLHGGSACITSDSELHSYYYRVMAAIERVQLRYDAASWIVVQCNDPGWTMHAHRRFPRINIMFDSGDELREGQVDTAIANGYYGLAVMNKACSPALVSRAHAGGLHVEIYGANATADIIDAINCSPDILLADNIPLVENILAQ